MTFVYLDQAPWINLRERDEDDETRQLIEQQAQSGDITIQLLQTLFAETGKHRNKSVREHHIEYLFDVSRGHVLRNFQDVKHIEKRNYAQRFLGYEFNLAEEVRGKGAADMYGNPKLEIDGEDVLKSDSFDKETKREFRELLQSRKGFSLLADESFSEMVKEHHQRREEELVEIIEDTRGQMDDRFEDNSRRRRVETHSYFANYVLPDVISSVVNSGGWISFQKFDFEKYVQQGDEEVEQLFRCFPATYCYLTLSTRRDTEKSREAKPNDIYDIFSLAVAIPYSDIVVTEGLWVTQAKRAGLGEIFDTELLTSIDELADVLS
ncbi:hypothetical protein ACFQE1_02115 [Halobium palmae]|uniref:Uncharacterized protein n=1 Tax=Halobium palmae TaxID=1776492 RepID=A0ABD5RVP6_9EURY